MPIGILRRSLPQNHSSLAAPLITVTVTAEDMTAPGTREKPFISGRRLTPATPVEATSPSEDGLGQRRHWALTPQS
jgi:hypothetical protein